MGALESLARCSPPALLRLYYEYVWYEQGSVGI